MHVLGAAATCLVSAALLGLADAASQRRQFLESPNDMPSQEPVEPSLRKALAGRHHIFVDFHPAGPKSAGTVPSQPMQLSDDTDMLYEVASHAATMLAPVQRLEDFAGSFISPPPSPAGGAEPLEPPELDPTRTYLDVLYSWIAFLLMSILVYFTCYKSCMPPPSPLGDVEPRLEDLQKTFTTGHWLCFEDSSICFCSFCCLALRWSDTQGLVKILGFWAAFGAFSIMGLFNGLFALGPLFTTGLMLYYRQQLRQKLDLDSHTCGSCCADCCYIFWCPCCAVAQEARIAKDAIESGHEFQEG
mmetsp:Transcript_27086/g.50912  ORF Transcript_27086/g.50912 Transcript_27086/m.50912 type:complete len:302 (-) Transcript_27086:50-955(-)